MSLVNEICRNGRKLPDFSLRIERVLKNGYPVNQYLVTKEKHPIYELLGSITIYKRLVLIPVLTEDHYRGIQIMIDYGLCLNDGRIDLLCLVTNFLEYRLFDLLVENGALVRGKQLYRYVRHNDVKITDKWILKYFLDKGLHTLDYYSD
jgi:hypothetical protein